MFDPLSMVTAAVSGGLDIAGGFIDDARNRRMADESADAQRQFAQHGIQWRVEDAKRAGIHPLYALGAQTHSFSPTVIGSNVGGAMSRAGQDVGRSIERGFDHESRKQAFLSNQLLMKQIERTEAERRLIEQQGLEIMTRRGENQSGGIPGLMQDPDAGLAVSGQQDSGLFQAVPPKRSTTIPGVPGIQAGPEAWDQRFIQGTSLPILLPWSSEGPSETLENIPFWMWPGIVAKNSQVYGSQWFRDWAGLTFFGRLPQKRSWKPDYRASSERGSGREEFKRSLKRR